MLSCGALGDGVPHGYGKVCVSFGSSGRNVTQADKDAATLRVYFNGLPVEKKDGVFEKLVAVGTRLSVTAEAVAADGKIIGKGEKNIVVKGGYNNVQMQVLTYDNFVVTVNGKATGYTNFTDAWNAANGKTATIKMNADTSISAGMTISSNVMLDMNGHKIDTSALIDDSVFKVSNSAHFTLNDSAGGGSIFFIGKKSLSTSPSFKGNINVAENATFVMNGGNISIDTVFSNGGSPQGGGVYVSKDGKFIMNGGSITNCKVAGGSSPFGGGVYVNGGTFEMHGGYITGCKSNSGGGVRIESGTFNWNGGTISGNTVIANGNNVTILMNSTYILNGVPQDTSQVIYID